MEPLVVLLSVVLLVVWIGLPIWTIVSVLTLRRKQAELTSQIEELKNELQQLWDKETSAAPVKAAAEPARPNPFETKTPPVAQPIPSFLEAPPTQSSQPNREPPLRVEPSHLPQSLAASATESTHPKPEAPKVPPPLPTRVPLGPTTTPQPILRKVFPKSPQSAINWEQFMGVKLFAWLGGLALFLGVVFFLKYSFDHDLIPRELRAAIGFMIGGGLVAGGLKLARRYAVTGQTLCATGIVSLYAVTFACRAHYHFSWFGVIPTFALMALITATAFLLAVRLEAQVVAILGILGGFLTPLLLSTGVDNPGGLFGYLALLDAGLIAVALHRRWPYLVPLGAVGTVLMEMGWMNEFFAAEKLVTFIIVHLGYVAIFLCAVNLSKRRGPVPQPLLITAAALPFAAFAFCGYFLTWFALAAQPGKLFTFVLLADAAVLALAWWETEAITLLSLAGAAVFLLLACWTGNSLTNELLPWALAIYLAFAALHTAGPLVIGRRRPAGSPPVPGTQLWPAVTLLLLLITINRLPVVPLLVWPAVLLLDLMAIGLAVATASLIGLAAVLVLTLIATGYWIFGIPADLTALPALLLVLGGFAALFFFAGMWVTRRLGGRLNRDEKSLIPINVLEQIPALAVMLPFTLLLMVVERLPLADPSQVFGLALLLTGFALGLARIFRSGWLPAANLLGVLALEYTWHGLHFRPARGPLALGWYLGFYAVFTGFPFVFRKNFAGLPGPWIAAALSGPLHYALFHRLIAATWPNDLMGLLPAVLVLPALAQLVAVQRSMHEDDPQRLGRLAWFGGVALFFITLIFPVQFDRQWITLGWALEGAALLWMFHRLPHPGVRLAGLGLLIAAFSRLALNPAVLEYHTRSTPIFNWYLYSYAVTAAALFAGSRLLAPPRDRVLGSSAPPLLHCLGTVLLFLLLNLEIADYFSPPAGTLTFEFSGNLARDMSYTIAWALFAFGLLIAGVWRRLAAARIAALVLLGVVLLKLFLHDLASLDNLYRIGALVVVAVIAILASFIYQRFLPATAAIPVPRPGHSNEDQA